MSEERGGREIFWKIKSGQEVARGKLRGRRGFTSYRKGGRKKVKGEE